MVRKLTPTIGRWGKRSGTTVTHRDFERSASRALAALPSNSPPWRDDLARQLTDHLLNGRTVDPHLADAVRAAVTAIVHIETQPLRPPQEAPADILEAVTNRLRLRGLLTFKDNADQLLRTWIDALSRTLRLVVDAAPAPQAASPTNAAFTVPLIDLMKNPTDLVQQIVSHLLRFASDDPYTVRPGAVLAHRIQHALLNVSKLTEDAARKNPHRLVPPADSGLAGIELVRAYLDDTPLVDLLQIRMPFTLTARFSHHHIVATPGAGKTNLIGVLLAQDLDEVHKGRASVIVLDSQGDLIKSIVRHKDFAPGGRLHERLVYIDPTDIEHPLELNFFARRSGNRARTLLEKQTEHANLVDLLLFLFGAMKQETTGRQETLIKAVASLIQEIPDATLMTLNAIFAPVNKKNPGLPMFEPYFPRLHPAVQEFFAVDFLSAEFSQTRAQMRARVQSLITDPIFCAMFGATTQKLHFAAEMDAGKVILINAYEDLLKEGTETFGRFFIALAGQGAQARQNIPEHRRLPTYLYIDECYKFIKTDTNVETILDTGRKYRLGIILAHQRLAQLSPALISATSGAAIKMVRAPNPDDTRTLAHQLATTPAYFDALPNHAFATRITGMRHPVALTMPLSPFATAEHMTDAEFAVVRSVMRRKYARAHAAPTHSSVADQLPRPHPTSPAPPATSTPIQLTPDRSLLKPGKDW